MTLKIPPSPWFLGCVPPLLAALGCSTAAPSPPSPVPSAAAPAAAEEDADPARAGLGDLLAELGVAWLPEEERLEISGWVNLQEGAIEVFACTPGGKTHESVLVLDCVPRGMQAGLLALGLSPGTPVAIGETGAVTPPTGDRVEVTVTWTDESGARREARAEDWIWKQNSGAPMTRGGWIFAGSIEAEAVGDETEVTFAADLGRSLITTYYDSSAILESPDEQAGNDEAYLVHHEVVPPVGTQVTVILRAEREGAAR